VLIRRSHFGSAIIAKKLVPKRNNHLVRLNREHLCPPGDSRRHRPTRFSIHNVSEKGTRRGNRTEQTGGGGGRWRHGKARGARTSVVAELDVGLSAVSVEVGGCGHGVDGLGVEFGGELEVVIDEGLLGLARQIRLCHAAPPPSGLLRRRQTRREETTRRRLRERRASESRIIELSLVDAGLLSARVGVVLDTSAWEEEAGPTSYNQDLVWGYFAPLPLSFSVFLKTTVQRLGFIINTTAGLPLLFSFKKTSRVYLGWWRKYPITST
jgi:hypothetical protein